MFIPGRHSQPTQQDLHITGLISQQSQIICIQHVWDVHTRVSGDSPWYTLSNVVNIVNMKGKNRGDRGQPCLTPWVGCTQAVLSPSFKTYSSRKKALLNEQIRLIISRLFLRGTFPSSSFFRLVHSITQPLIALSIRGLHKPAEQNGTDIMTGTELQKIYERKTSSCFE